MTILLHPNCEFMTIFIARFLLQDKTRIEMFQKDQTNVLKKANIQ